MRHLITLARSHWPRFRTSRDRPGQNLVEYGLILALIAIIVIIGLLVLGPLVGHVFNHVSSNLNIVQPSQVQAFPPSPSPT